MFLKLSPKTKKIKFNFLLIFIFLCQYAIAQDRTMGLFLNTPQSFNGYTLFSNNETSYLIDNCGEKIQQWQSDYKAASGVYFLPNGDLLRAGTLAGDFNAGGRGGIFELFAWNGQLKWQFEIADESQHAHHDLAILPNGNFLCTVWEKKPEAVAKSQGRQFDGDVWSERILEIQILPNNQARIVWEWSVWDHLIQNHDATKANYGIIAEHPELIDLNYIGAGEETSGDWLHINGISYHADFDQIAIVSRNTSEIYIIDHSTTTEEAAGHTGGRYGKGGDILYRHGNPEVYGYEQILERTLNRPHHINWVTTATSWAGAFSVFNNEYIDGVQSQAVVFNNPADDQGHYHFMADVGYGDEQVLTTFTHPSFYSDILSGVQVLPNNNLLILEGRQGHLIEVDENGQIVWEYLNPVNKNGGPGIQGGAPRFNSLFRAIRYAPDFTGFSDKDLSPSGPIELSPLEQDCEIYDEVVSTVKRTDLQALRILTNPVEEMLTIVLDEVSDQQAALYSLEGKMWMKFKLYEGMNRINLVGIPSGIYFLQSQGHCQKIIKH